jgi:hypothetical protein
MGNKDCIAIDGEAYIHGMPLQKIVSLARKYQKGKTEQLQYYVFDLIVNGKLSFSDRYSILEKAVSKLNSDNIVLVPIKEIQNELEMKEYHGVCLQNGFEGVIIRHNNVMYDIGKRCPNLFKYKEFFDIEAKIENVWGNAMLTVKLKNGIILDLTPKRTHAERKEMLNQKESLIGKWIWVKYQAETKDGNLQFPIGLELRECDDEGNPID